MSVPINRLDTSSEVEAYLENVQHGAFASYWLRDAIEALLKRDCLDAARDVEFLADWLGHRAKLILEGK